MHYRLLILFMGVLILDPSLAFATEAEKLFSRPYSQLLEEVADASPLFENPVAVRQAIESKDGQNRIRRLRKRIAVARMLLADDQLQSEKKISYLFVRMSASQLIKTGEKWVLMVQTRVDEEEGEEKQKERNEKGRGESQVVREEQTRPQEKVIIIERKRRDNRFDIFDDDEFNLFDVIAFPFRLVEMILELLFNILLFPFKIITKILF